MATNDLVTVEERGIVMTPAQEPAPRRNSSGLHRDIAILELLGSDEAFAAGGYGVTQVAQHTGRDKTVVSRALATLADSGLIERDEATLRYLPGHRLYGLAARTSDSYLIHTAGGHLRRLTLATRETSHLCVLRGGNVLTLISELSPHEVRTNGWAGFTTAAWRTPSGRALLSDWDKAALAHWYELHGHDHAVVGPILPEPGPFGFPVLDNPVPGRGEISDLDSLFTELGLVHELGYAVSDEELESGVVAASAPVTDFTGRVVAAINVSAPRPRIGERLDTLGAFVSRAAQELSVRLGAEPAS